MVSRTSKLKLALVAVKNTKKKIISIGVAKHINQSIVANSGGAAARRAYMMKDAKPLSITKK
jgi:hypothetical protein